MKFVQLIHFDAYSVLVKGIYDTLIDFEHICTFYIFNIIKIYFAIIIIKPRKMIKYHTLSYFCTRRNICKVIIDEIHPNILLPFSLIIWHVRSGGWKSTYPWNDPTGKNMILILAILQTLSTSIVCWKGDWCWNPNMHKTLICISIICYIPQY